MRRATVRELTVDFSEGRSELVVRRRKDVSYETYEVFRKSNQYEIVNKSIDILLEENDSFLEDLSDFDEEYFASEPRRKNRYVSEDKRALPKGKKIQKGKYWISVHFGIALKKRLIKQMCKVAEVDFQHKRVPDKLI